jgi:ADP-L-glycero-D-manno-heptose 6-epimerase
MGSRSGKYVVVTGGAGFIGSCVLRELNDREIDKILVVDDLVEKDKWQNLLGKAFFDILHKDHLFEWLQGRESEIGAFIHLGACTDTTEDDANFLIENNYRYSKKLVEYALKHGIRFLYASSAATYGDGSLGFSDDHEKLEILRPLNMYGYSKHLFDLWLLREGFLSRVTGLKYFNVFGPNESHKGRMASQIIRMVPQAMQTGTIQLFRSYNPLYKDGEQLRDFIYVKDVAAITCDFLFSDKRGIFNVGTGKAVSWNRLAEAVFQALGKPPSIEYIPMPQDLVGKYQYFTQAEVKKSEEALQRSLCSFDLEEAVFDYVHGHLLQDKRW